MSGIRASWSTDEGPGERAWLLGGGGETGAFERGGGLGLSGLPAKKRLANLVFRQKSACRLNGSRTRLGRRRGALLSIGAVWQLLWCEQGATREPAWRAAGSPCASLYCTVLYCEYSEHTSTALVAAGSAAVALARSYGEASVHGRPIARCRRRCSELQWRWARCRTPSL